jgi:Zn finger protein HypA/HybF involved in hydrogenase expression
MTPEQKRAHFSERQKLVEFITAHPSRFYICEGCEAILDSVAPVIFCPMCHGYHFSYDRGRLLDLVTILVKKPPEEVAEEQGDYR